MSRRILAVALSLLLSGLALPAQTAPTGVVLQSASARLNATDAAVGTTIFDGDRMETQEKGALSLRSGQVLGLSPAVGSVAASRNSRATAGPRRARFPLIT